MAALQAYPGGLQVGGGITPENAGDYLNAGASHVIVTSYVFREGRIDYDRLERLVYRWVENGWCWMSVVNVWEKSISW